MPLVLEREASYSYYVEASEQISDLKLVLGKWLSSVLYWFARDALTKLQTG